MSVRACGAGCLTADVPRRGRCAELETSKLQSSTLKLR